MKRGGFAVLHNQQLTVWYSGCFLYGMNYWMILLAAQVVIAAVALIRERGEDKSFAGDKLGFRS